MTPLASTDFTINETHERMAVYDDSDFEFTVNIELMDTNRLIAIDLDCGNGFKNVWVAPFDVPSSVTIPVSRFDVDGDIITARGIRVNGDVFTVVWPITRVLSRLIDKNIKLEPQAVIPTDNGYVYTFSFQADGNNYTTSYRLDG